MVELCASSLLQSRDLALLAYWKVGIRFFTVGGAFIMCLPVPYIPHT